MRQKKSNNNRQLILKRMHKQLQRIFHIVTSPRSVAAATVLGVVGGIIGLWLTFYFDEQNQGFQTALILLGQQVATTQAKALDAPPGPTQTALATELEFYKGAYTALEATVTAMASQKDNLTEVPGQSTRTAISTNTPMQRRLTPTIGSIRQRPTTDQQSIPLTSPIIQWTLTPVPPTKISQPPFVHPTSGSKDPNHKEPILPSPTQISITPTPSPVVVTFPDPCSVAPYPNPCETPKPIIVETSVVMSPEPSSIPPSPEPANSASPQPDDVTPEPANSASPQPDDVTPEPANSASPQPDDVTK